MGPADDPFNVYAGRLFQRPGEVGHMFVQHYLDTMFGPQQDFLDTTMKTVQLRSLDETENPQHVAPPQQTVRQVSRLAKYLGGKSPPDLSAPAPRQG